MNKDNKISEKDLQNVTGGYVYQNPNGGATPYEMIDDFNGTVLGATSSKKDCMDSALLNGLSPRMINSDELEILRKRSN